MMTAPHMIGPQRGSSSHIQTICFHGIGAPQRQLEPGEERFWITEDSFCSILEVIRSHSRMIDITFDDANSSDATIALPELVKRGLSARFFIITDRIDTAGSLSSLQIEDMAGAGMTFGTHGASHRPWPLLASEGLLGRELDESAARLEALLGTRTDHAAFPQGLYNRAVLGELRTRGFARAYSVDEGWSRRRAWLRSRYSVIHSDTAAIVGALLDDPNHTTASWPVRSIKQAVKRWR